MGIARPVSGWVHSATSAKTVASDGARAVQAALPAPGQIATLILPADTAWLEADRPAPPLPVTGPARVDAAAIDQVVEALRGSKKTTLLIGGAALRRRGLEAAGRIAAKTGARLACDTFTARLERGAGLVALERIPYFAEQIVEFMKDTALLVLVGTKPPVSFFAYPGRPSWCMPEGCRILYLTQPHEDGVAALEAVAEALGAPREPAGRAELKKPELSTGYINSLTAGQVIAHYLPENAIIAEEAGTAIPGIALLTANAPPHDYLSLTGGSIGQGLPVATGAAVACPGRKVVCLEGDGSGMYTLQALWTQAREKLDVTTVIFANRSYVILNVELKRVGAERGPKAMAVLDLHNPVLDWVSLAQGMGVEASRATTAEELAAQFASAMAARGPRLIEAVVSR
jgi:acetolactate synthase I/II/III large subunit